RPAVCVRRLFVDADRLLSSLSGHGGRSGLACLLATLDRAAVLAGRSALVFVGTIGVRPFGGCALFDRAAFDRNAWPVLRLGGRRPEPVFSRAAGGRHHCLRAARLCFWRV